MKSRRGIVGLGLLVLIVGSACGISSQVGTPAAGDAETPTSEPATEAPLLPVSINEGLASLDSYRMTYTTDVFNSVTRERSVSTFVVSSDADADASYNRTETRVTGEADELVSEDVQEQYMIGNQVCQVAGGEAELTTMSDTARVMSDLMSRVVVFKPLIENPVYVGRGCRQRGARSHVHLRGAEPGCQLGGGGGPRRWRLCHRCRWRLPGALHAGYGAAHGRRGGPRGRVHRLLHRGFPRGDQPACGDRIPAELSGGRILRRVRSIRIGQLQAHNPRP